MDELKPLDYKILFQLMKNARISDRSLAKVLGVSQPTVTRRRASLEKEVVDGYTVIPKWEKLGFTILAITLAKLNPVVYTGESQYKLARKKAQEWLKSHPNIVMAGNCQGVGVDSFSISFHKSYSDFDDFMTNLRLEVGELMYEMKVVLVNLRGKEILKPLHLKYLAETE